MNPKAKRILYIALFGLDMAVTIFLFIVSIIMIATMPTTKDAINQNTFIGFLQYNTNVFLLAVVVPLFALLAVNVFVLIQFLRKNGKAKEEKKKVSASDLSDAERELLLKELASDLAGGSAPKAEEKPEEKKEDAE